jgi:hypothetical protein
MRANNERKLSYFTEHLMRELHRFGEKLTMTMRNGEYTTEIVSREGGEVTSYAVPNDIYVCIFRVYYQVLSTEMACMFEMEKKQDAVLFYKVCKDGSSSYVKESFDPASEIVLEEIAREYRISTQPFKDNNAFTFTIERADNIV